jgi:hypothetical protein
MFVIKDIDLYRQSFTLVLKPQGKSSNKKASLAIQLVTNFP